MVKRNVFSFFIAVFLLFFYSCPFARGQQQITLTTYYPAPYGVYKNLRLFPSSKPTCNANQRGLLYYDTRDNKVWVCRGALGWKEVGLWTTLRNNIYYNIGNVGIGTTSPGNKLEVVGNIEASGGRTYRRLDMSTTNNQYFLQVEDSAFDGIGFYKNLPAPAGFQMVLTTGGNVGIGTTSPGDKLEVVGGIRVDGYIRARDSGGLALKTDEGTTRLFVKDNGNVGIGTTRPSQKLDINGQIRIRGGSLGAGKVLTSDARGVGSWQSPAAGNIANNIKFGIVEAGQVMGGRDWSWHTYVVTTGFSKLFSAIAIPQWGTTAGKYKTLEQVGMKVSSVRINDPSPGKFRIRYGIRASWEKKDQALIAEFIWIAIGQ